LSDLQRLSQKWKGFKNVWKNVLQSVKPALEGEAEKAHSMNLEVRLHLSAGRGKEFLTLEGPLSFIYPVRIHPRAKSHCVSLTHGIYKDL